MHRLIGTALCLTMLGCANGSGGTGPIVSGNGPVATSLRLLPQVDTIKTLGTTTRFAPIVTDQYGATMSGVTVEWSSSAPATAPVSGSLGLVTGRMAGEADINAQVGSLSATAHIVVLDR
ncbi:MAG: Ig-like domain-containing protein [Gemmatimonadaceae bacterium]